MEKSAVSQETPKPAVIEISTKTNIPSHSQIPVERDTSAVYANRHNANNGVSQEDGAKNSELMDSDGNEEDSEGTVCSHDAEPERGNWTGRFDFLLSLLGYSVGLGNVWRFPYLCYNNGGGAFLIPFTIMLIIAGLPLMFMELSFGQYAALGPVAVYNKFCPLFQGLGYGMVIVSTIVMLYYNLIIAWTIYYMAVSFNSIFYQLPWQNCDADWSTKHCYSYEEANDCELSNGTYYLRLCINQTYSVAHNISALAKTALRRPPAEEYFTNQVLGLSSGIEETGHIRWRMATCLFAAWLIVFLCLCKGVQSSGKVVYFTALFPYVVLVILFFRGVTLPGASNGIIFYLKPDFSQLANAQVWGDAAVQIFFALSPAWGGLITLSSYNKFSNNCYIDSLIVAVSNIATSFFAGLVIFSVIGFLAHELNVEVDRVVDQGAGLAFIVYPEVVTRLPVSPLWSILFFVMLLTLGLDSQFALMETVTTAILDNFPNYRNKKVWVVFFVAVFGYAGGLIFTTNSGMYWLQLMDKYAANWSVLIIAIGECILIAWIYGAEKFCNDIQSMIGRQSKLWVFFWSAMWRVITPAALVFILVFNWIEYKPASYGNYVYPMWADAIGWTLGVLPVVVVVLMAIDQICNGPDDLTIMQTSQDGGDSNSVSSGIENDMRKPSATKTKKSSIKRKVQNASHESDKTVIEPLLQKKKTETSNYKFECSVFSKTKTDSVSQKEKGKENLLQAQVSQTCSVIDTGSITNSVTLSSKPNILLKSTSGVQIPLHNHMNTNVFNSPDSLKNSPTTKSHILVEIEGTNQSGYHSSPLIFTTAKIHTDFKTKHMEPSHITSVLSTIELNIPKGTNNNNTGDASTYASSQINTKLYKDNKNTPNNKIIKTPDKFPSQNFVDVTTSSSKDKAINSNSVLSNDKKLFINTVVTSDPNNVEIHTDDSYKNIVTKSLITDTKQDKLAIGNMDTSSLKESSITFYKNSNDKISTENKQLRRQKMAVDKDEPIYESNSYAVNSPLANRGNAVQNPEELNNFNCMSKFPKSSALNVQNTVPMTSTKNKIPTTLTTTETDKSTILNTISSIKPSITSQAPVPQTTPKTKAGDAIVTSIPQPSSTIKPLSKTVTSIVSEAKSIDTVVSTVPQISTPSCEPLTTTAPTVASQLISNTKLISFQPIINQQSTAKVISSKTTMRTETNKLTENNKIDSSVSISMTKNPSVSTTLVKKPSVTTSTVKPSTTKNNIISDSKVSSTLPSASVVIVTTTTSAASPAANTHTLNKIETKSSEIGDGKKNIKP